MTFLSEEDLLKEIKRGEIPGHICIVMDGNGRWAQSRNLPRTEGHKAGLKAVMSTIEGCLKMGVQWLSLFAFSTENFQRPPEEVNQLFNLFVTKAQEEVDNLKKNGIRVFFLGDTGKLPSAVINTIKFIENETEKGESLNVVVCLNYSGRWDIIAGVRSVLYRIKQDIEKEKDSSSKLLDSWISIMDADFFRRFMPGGWIPDPDIFIRTSGELRISNYFLFQIAYTELFFTKVLWPDFRKEHLYEIVLEYQRRERRFGKVLNK